MRNIMRLGDVASYINGFPFKPSDWSDMGVPIIRIQDLTGNGYQMNRFDGKYDAKYEVRAGDVLISWSASLGVYVWKLETAVLNQHIFKVRFDKVDVDKDFFVYQVECLLKKAARQAHGATMRHLTKPVFDGLPFYLPPKEEQKRIAVQLNAITRLISIRQRQAEKLDELVKARFVEMFGDLAAPNCKWKTIKIVEACENENDIKCGPFGTQLSKNEYQETGVAVWEIPQINSGFQMVPTHFLTAEKAEALRDYSIVPGDIAMSRKGNVGRCAVFPESLEAGIIHSDVLRIRVNHEIVSAVFLMYQLHFSEAVKHQIAIVSLGAIMAGINVTKLKKIRIHIPPLPLQNAFATFVHEVDREKEHIQRSAALLETLKRSLMQQYFG